jgi:hypothetical protein
MPKRPQITVPMDPALRDLVEGAAADADRTIANWCRRILGAAAVAAVGPPPPRRTEQPQERQQERAA